LNKRNLNAKARSANKMADVKGYTVWVVFGWKLGSGTSGWQSPPVCRW